jgi:hypothetical protein
MSKGSNVVKYATRRVRWAQHRFEDRREQLPASIVRNYRGFEGDTWTLFGAVEKLAYDYRLCSAPKTMGNDKARYSDARGCSDIQLAVG